jgi:hypothetical protein
MGSRQPEDDVVARPAFEEVLLRVVDDVIERISSPPGGGRVESARSGTSERRGRAYAVVSALGAAYGQQALH